MDKTDNMPTRPENIERRSFEIIAEELRDMGAAVPEDVLPVVKRVIHTTADFEFADSLYFSDGAVKKGMEALRSGGKIITDTRMAQAGINKRVLGEYGGEAYCYIGDEDVAEAAKREGGTRSRAAVDKAAGLWPEAVYVVGNAPTALIRICELVREGRLRPKLVVGVPVGFVNVIESKELLMRSGVTHIVARGRKGGSAVAAAICNALLYSL